MEVIRIIKFGLVGTVGFFVDVIVLYLCLYGLSFGYYDGRLMSYLVAATVTWSLNRKYTFADISSNELKTWQWARFLFFNISGGIVNYGSYAILISTSNVVKDYPIIGVAIGSLLGMGANYIVSKVFVFK